MFTLKVTYPDGHQEQLIKGSWEAAEKLRIELVYEQGCKAEIVQWEWKPIPTVRKIT